MRWAEQYLRIPFVDRGETHAGCDCWGLLRLILKEQAGLDIPSYSDIKPGDWARKVREIVGGAESGEQWERIEPGRERAFDGVLMRGHVRDNGRVFSRPLHVACVISPGRLIHAEDGFGVTVGDYRQHPRIKPRVIAFYRFKND